MTPQEIRDLRESVGLSRRKMGALIDMSGAAIESWERGLKKPRRNSIKLIKMIIVPLAKKSGKEG